MICFLEQYPEAYHNTSNIFFRFIVLTDILQKLFEKTTEGVCGESEKSVGGMDMTKRHYRQQESAMPFRFQVLCFTCKSLSMKANLEFHPAIILLLNQPLEPRNPT